MNKMITIKTPGFFTLLGIVFIVLKLIGTINWSWWLVLLPIYGPICIVLLVLIVLILLAIWANVR